MGVKSLAHKKILKKRTKKFVRFESEDFGKIKSSWRRNHGIDNRMRRRMRGNRPMPKIGYGADQKTRHLLKSGFKKLLITAPKDIEILLMNNKTFAGELASNLSARKKAAIVKRATELNVRLTNGKGKLKIEEKKAEK